MKPHILEMLQDYAVVPGAERVVEEGDAAVSVADYASRHGVDLIMMPTHGYGKFRTLLMGSVVSKVLHDAECAVWTAPHAEDPAMREHLPCRNIVVAVDRGVEQIPVLRRATELAQELGAGLSLVHAVPGAERMLADTGGDEFGLFLLDAARKDMVKLQAGAGTSFGGFRHRRRSGQGGAAGGARSSRRSVDHRPRRHARDLRSAADPILRHHSPVALPGLESLRCAPRC